MCGKSKRFTKDLGITDEDVTETIAKYFGGAMMEARRIMEPPGQDEEPQGAASVSSHRTASDKGFDPRDDPSDASLSDLPHAEMID